MNKVKTIIGFISRILTIGILSIFSFLSFLNVLLSPLIRDYYEIPQIVLTFHKIFNLLFLIIFVYGIYLLIRNNRKYLKLFLYCLPAYYLFMTIYRFFFITHGQFENTDLSNFIFFFTPLLLMVISYKMDTNQTTSMPAAFVNEPFTPLQYQGIIVRGLANIVDQILISLPILLVAFLTNAGSENLEIYVAVGSVFFYIYLVVAEFVWGQTFGKKLFGIKVMMQDGRKCTLLGAILRNILRTIDMIFGGYLIAMIVMTITPKKQRLGDLIAKTVVIKT